MTLKSILFQCFGVLAFSAPIFGQTPVLLADLNPGTGDCMDEYYPKHLLFDNKIYLNATDGSVGNELFVIENNQILLLKDINPGPNGSKPEQFVAAMGKIFFVADDGSTGKELWVSDGTSAGTNLVTDLVPGTDGANPQGLIIGGDGRAYFSSNQKLYASDGTSNGTIAFTEPNGVDLQTNWVHDGNIATAFGSGIAFAGKVGLATNQIWVTNGDQVKKVFEYEAEYFTDVFGFAPVKDGFVFCTFDDSYSQHIGVFSYKEPVDSVARLSTGLFFMRLLPLNLEKVVFLSGLGSSAAYYVTDGTTNGTQLLTNETAELFQGEVLPFGVVNNKLIMPGTEGSFQWDMIVTDGTPAGTQKLATIDEPFFPHTFVSNGNDAFFASGINNGFEAQIWQTNGKPAGTKKLHQYPGGSGLETIIPLSTLDNQFIYASTYGGVGREVYRLQFAPTAAVDEPEIGASPYFSFKYDMGENMGTIEGKSAFEPIQIEFYDETGRLLNSIKTSTGSVFSFPESAKPNFLRVTGGSHIQSFVKPY